MADKYILQVTAGPNYKDQKPLAVNSEESVQISNEHLTVALRVRIQNYRGLPENSPKTSPYFDHENHKKDLYSLAFTFTPKKDLNGHDVVFGNDFDHPIKDKLPPGFSQAFKIATWYIDPGLYGDVYADEPYLYSPLLSSMNVLRIGPKDDAEQEKVEEIRANEETLVFLEGADGDGKAVRDALKVPEAGPQRQKHFLTESNLKDFTFEKGREYSNDFFNPYLDFNGVSMCTGYLGGRTAVLTMRLRLCPKASRFLSDPRHHDPHHKPLGRPTTPVSRLALPRLCGLLFVEEKTDVRTKAHTRLDT
jgi:hypothetical protein